MTASKQPSRTHEKRVHCDVCGQLVELCDAVLWWVGSPEPNPVKLSRCWVTCRPYACGWRAEQPAHSGERLDTSTWPPERHHRVHGVPLFDASVEDVAGRFVSWARDYAVEGETVAKLALRIWPAIAAVQQAAERVGKVGAQ